MSVWSTIDAWSNCAKLGSGFDYKQTGFEVTSLKIFIQTLVFA